MKANHSVSVGPGYQGPSGAQPIAAFDFSLPIETAGKRGYRIANATHLRSKSPLAIVILGGLVTSTALNLLVLPTLALRFGIFEARSLDE